MFLLFLPILLILSAWFSGMELAMFSITPAKIKQINLEKKKNSSTLQKLLNNKKRLLVTILLGNNLVNIGTASLSTLWVSEKFGSASVGIATGAITLLILIFGEMYPKAFFQANSERMALKFSPLILIIEIIFFPVIWVLEKLLNVLTKKSSDDSVSEQEMKALSRLAVEEGTINFKEHEMIVNVLELEDKTAKDIMTPRYKMKVINDEAEVDQVAYFMAQEGFSRYPVFHNQEDNIIGYVHVMDILKVLNSDERENRIEKYNTTILEVDENDKIDKILNRMIREKIHIALVYREQEQVLGMLTMEDILEQIVGEIEDEND